MTLLITVFAAIIATIVWYKNCPKDEMKIGTLCWLYWGASIMWLVDALFVLLSLSVFAAFLYGLYYAGIKFIRSGAGLLFLLFGASLFVPILALLIMGMKIDFKLGERAEPVLEFLTRPFSRLSAKRRDSYLNLLNETNMVVGPRPSAEEYYDSRAKIEFENSEIFNSQEL